MTEFSLSRRAEKVCPTSIEVNGCTFFINADFRVMLKIIKLFGDTEILDEHKGAMALSWFFDGDIPEDGQKIMLDFIGRGEASNGEQKMCFEFDAPEIYASFLMQYGIDLLDVPFLHWAKFKALLSGLGTDTPFVRKLRLRSLDTSKLKGKERSEAEEAKREVQIPEKHSRAEIAYQQRLEQALMNGEDISELLQGR